MIVFFFTAFTAWRHILSLRIIKNNLIVNAIFFHNKQQENKKTFIFADNNNQLLN